MISLVRKIDLVKVLGLKRHSLTLPTNNSFLASISATIGRVLNSDSHMSDLHDFNRLSEFLQMKY